MASHAFRLVRALARSPLAPRLRIAVPKSGRAHVPDGIQAMLLPESPLVNPLLREAVWQNRLGAHVKRHHPTDVLLALSPFYSWSWPDRVVVVWHDLIPFRFKRYMGRFLYRRFLLRARLSRVKRTSLVVTDSRHTAAELRSFLPDVATPVTTIHLWVSPESSWKTPRDGIGAVRHKYGLPERYWLYVGGYDYRKNVEFLVRAYADAKKMSACPPLVLAGKIPVDLRKPVCDIRGAMKAAGLGESDVYLPGFIEPEDMGGLYSGASLFVYPSRAEGFGYPPLEAMACGCPAIVADLTSLPEVVVDAKYRFPALNSAVLAEMLQRAARQPVPLNPSFDRDYFSEERGIKEYCDAMERFVL